jgi:PKD repeat protein
MLIPTILPAWLRTLRRRQPRARVPARKRPLVELLEERELLSSTAGQLSLTGTSTSSSFVLTSTQSSTTLKASAGPVESGSEGKAVGFSGSVQGGQAPYSYAWNFGDGTTATGTLTPSHTYTQDGKYTVTLTVTDAAGATSKSQTTATIAEVPPTASISGAPPSGYITVGSAVNLTASATDPDPVSQPPSFSYSWVVTKNGAAWLYALGPSLSFTPDATATYVATVTATDPDHGQSAPVSTKIIADGTASVQASAGPAQSGSEGNAVTFSGSAQGGTAPYSYAWSFGDGTTASGTLTPSHTYAQDGTYTVTLDVTDVMGETSISQTTATIAEAPPTATIAGAPASGQVTVGTAVTLTGSATDPDPVSQPPGFTYSWAVTRGGSPWLVATGPTLSFTPDTAATYVATLVATDADNGQSAPVSTTIVANASAPLQAGAGPAESGNEGSAVSFLGSAQGGTAPYSYAWSFGDGTTTSGTAVPAHTYAQDGKYTITLTVTDASGATSTSQTTAAIAEVPPAASISGAPATGHVYVGTAVTLTASATDPDPVSQPPTFTYSWSVTQNGNAWLTGTGPTLSFTPYTPATYVATLVATDADNGQSAPVSTTIVADPTYYPYAEPGPAQSGTVGNAVTFSGAVYGGVAPYSYVWNFGDGTTAKGNTGAGPLAQSHTYAQSGTYTVTLTVSDATGTMASGQTTATITNPSSALQVSAGPAQSGTVGSPVTFSGSAQGGTAPYSYSWNFGDGTTATGTATPSHTYASSGTYTVTLAVTDASNDSGTATTTASITAPSGALQVSAGSSQSGTEGKAVTFSGSVSGGTAPYTYSWTFGDGTTASGTATPAHTYAKDGTYTVTLTAKDSAGNSGTATTTATIAEGTLGVTINGAPAHSNPGTAIALTSTVTDPSGDTSFTYAWTVTKNGSTFATGTAASLTFTPDASASYVVTLTVHDADGGSGTAQQTITVDTNTGNLLLPASELSALQQQAAQNTPQWQAFKSQLDAGLPQILGFSGGDAAYEGSELKYIMDYALGYQVLKTSDPLTAANYADKALAMMKSAINDRQESLWFPLQFNARGNGSTTTFTIPNADYLPSSLQVWLGPVATKAVVRGTGSVDAVSSDQIFLKVSNTPDGPADYTEGVDWQPDPNQEDGNILWLPGGKQPAAGATYYVTLTNPTEGAGATSLGAGQYTVSGTTVTLTTAPTASQAVYFAYVYGTHSADGSTLAYQQTGSGNGGFANITIDTTYTSRNLGKYLALGLDWLDGYVGFSSTFKQQVESMLVQWFNYLRQNGYHYNDPGSNYGAGSYVSNMLTALALQNRDPVNGPVLMNDMLTYRTDQLLPLLTRNPGDPQPGSTTPDPHGSLNGGFWAEGWNYGPLAIQNLLLGSLALEDSGTITQATTERQWANQVIDNLISSTTDNGKSTYDGGDPLSWAPTFPNAQLFYVLASMASSSAEQSYANYILQNWNLPNADNAVKLLFDNPSAPAASWTSSLPLQDYAVGTGLVQARSDWGSTPVWASIEAANGIHADHQTAAPGTMDITRGADRLLVNGNAPGQQVSPPKSRNANVLIVDDNGDGVQETRYAEDDGLYYGSPGIVVNDYQATSAFTYFSVDLHAAYSNPLTPGQGGSASELTRQWVYLRPGYVVVFDRATTVKDTYTKEDRWHFTAAPTVSGNAFVETVGSSKLFGQAFSTLPLTTTVAPVQVGSATIEQMDVQNSTTSASVRYVTAFEATSSGTAAMDPTQHVLSTDQRMEGVQMGSDVVLFGRNGDVDLTTPVTYTFTGSASVQHLLTNLAAGANYQVTVNGTVLTTVTASAQGTITFTTTATGTATVQVAKV